MNKLPDGAMAERIPRVVALTRLFLFCFSADLPSFSDPHIPLVAREIMQRMIRQFAAEYTSKTTQDDPHLPNGTMKDQSLPRALSLAQAPRSPPRTLPAPGSPPSSASSSPALTPGPGLSPSSTGAASAPACTISSNGTGAAASAQNPVLSKLLMADQDGPLDLTVRKNQVDPEPSQQGEMWFTLSNSQDASLYPVQSDTDTEPGPKPSLSLFTQQNQILRPTN